MIKNISFNEYINIKDFKHLIGKRARFKNNLNTYCRHLWLKEGTIKQLYQIKKGDLDHVGLSIVFDKPVKRSKEDTWQAMKSCYIMPDSFELISNNKDDIINDEMYKEREREMWKVIREAVHKDDHKKRKVKQ